MSEIDRECLSFPLRAAQAGIKFGCALTQGGSLATSGIEAVGICVTADPVNSGDVVKVAYVGEIPYLNSHINVASARLMLTINGSGRAALADSGQYIVGRNLGNTFNTNANVNSVAIGRGLFNFINPPYVPSSAGGPSRAR